MCFFGAALKLIFLASAELSKKHQPETLMLLVRKLPVCKCSMRVCVCVCVVIQHRCEMQAGGYVLDGRVNGSLNLSRAIGDMEYKQTSHLSAAEQAVTAFPDVRQIQLGSSSEFMILACDGIWGVLNNQQVWALVMWYACMRAHGYL